MNNNTVIVLDIETTGLDYQREKILEFAAVKLVGNEITEQYETLVNPKQEIRQSSINIHGITQDMIEDQPTIEEVMPKILDFIGDYPIVGHNVIFDYNFIRRACYDLYNRSFDNHRIDSQHMFREVFPEEFSHGLEALMTRFGVEFTTRHRAMADTIGLAGAYPRLKDLFDQKYAWQMQQLKNIPYLFERYLRIQSAVQIMQSELQDLKSIFRLYFDEGGNEVIACTGEILAYNTKTTYSYDFEKVKAPLEEIGALEKAIKLNTGLLDRMIGGLSLSDELKDQLREGRLSMSENRSVAIIKPSKNISDFNE
jgi:DNA polymerase III epsilon subunit family exonuclease